jgi:hypothetical protein
MYADCGGHHRVANWQRSRGQRDCDPDEKLARGPPSQAIAASRARPTDVRGIPRLGAQSHPACLGHTAGPCMLTSYADLVTVAAYKLGIQAVRIRSR